ncbi:MAG: hypothetical protein ACI93R_003148 [Flavobacteriales bacterium]|jgi:hypothetical protein
MDSKSLWIVSTKSKPLDGCSIELDGSDFYYVECLIPASSFDEANGLIESLLQGKHMALLEVIKCEPYSSDSWKDLIQFPEIQNAADHANSKQEAKFSLFISSQAMDFEEDDSDEVEWT